MFEPGRLKGMLVEEEDAAAWPDSTMVVMTDSIESVAPSKTSTTASSALLNRKLGTPENPEEEFRPPPGKVRRQSKITKGQEAEHWSGLEYFVKQSLLNLNITYGSTSALKFVSGAFTSMASDFKAWISIGTDHVQI